MKDNSLFIIGESRTNSDNAITDIYGSFYIALEVEAHTGTIVDFSCTHTLEVTEKFLRKIFLGKSLRDDVAVLMEEIQSRYFGSSRKAIIVSLCDAEKRYKGAIATFN